MTSPLASLEKRLRAALPFAVTQLYVPSTEAVRHELEIRVGSRLFVVEWSPSDAFWVSEVRDDTVLDEPPDLCLSSAGDAADAIIWLIRRIAVPMDVPLGVLCADATATPRSREAA